MYGTEEQYFSSREETDLSHWHLIIQTLITLSAIQDSKHEILLIYHTYD
jgi:hypothetical protein